MIRVALFVLLAAVPSSGARAEDPFRACDIYVDAGKAWGEGVHARDSFVFVKVVEKEPRSRKDRKTDAESIARLRAGRLLLEHVFGPAPAAARTRVFQGDVQVVFNASVDGNRVVVLAVTEVEVERNRRLLGGTH